MTPSPSAGLTVLTAERVKEVRDTYSWLSRSIDADVIRALCDAWLAAQGREEWRTIETAPDGERVLVSYLFHGRRRASQVDIKEIQSDNKGDRCIWPSRYYEATHWRPLPPPPAPIPREGEPT